MELPNASESGEDDELDVNSFFDEKKSYQISTDEFGSK